MRRLRQRIVTNPFVILAVLISLFSPCKAVARENQAPDDERLRRLEEKIENPTQLKDKYSSPTPELQAEIDQLISAGIKRLNLDEQAIKIYSAKADISSVEADISQRVLDNLLAILTLIVAVFGVVGGVLGAIAYKGLKKSLKKGAKEIERELRSKIEKEAEEQKNVMLVKVLGVLGYAHWNLYDEKKDDVDLRTAVRSAEKAVGYADKIENKEEYEKEIADAKNNFVYYQLEQWVGLDRSEKSRVRKYARDILEISRKGKHQEGNDWYEWRDTYIWSLLIAKPNSDEQKRGEDMLRELMEHGRTPPEWREGTLRRYRRRFEWAKKEYPEETG